MKRALTVAALLGSAGLAGSARAESAAEILKLADEAYGAYKDLTLESTMIIKEPGATTGREIGMITQAKGDKKLVRFVSPGDIKGMGFLTESRDVMYALLPAFGNRVRRMGTHVKNQGFMGSDASFEDMSTSTWAEAWQPTLTGQDDKTWTLDLVLLPGHDGEFQHERIQVDKKIHQVTRIEYVDPAGKVVKVQTRGDWRLDAGTKHYTPEWIRITDHRRNDHITEIHSTKSVADAGLADDTFTQRNLVRGQ